jgi:hypothetical protein
VGRDVQAAIEPIEPLVSTAKLDDAVDRLIQAIERAVENYTPFTRSSTYSKRWFTLDLKQQQTKANKGRRQWQESCARQGKSDEQTMALFDVMRKKQREWTRAIERAESAHWKEFLDDARSNTTLWKAATFRKPRNHISNVPPLRVGDTEFHENTGKARIFLESFLKDLPKPEVEESGTPSEELAWHPLTECERFRLSRHWKL